MRKPVFGWTARRTLENTIYKESDKDYLLNNRELAVYLLNSYIKREKAMWKQIAQEPPGLD